MNIPVTPDTVSRILTKARAEYKEMHYMNSDHPMVAGCKLGAVFSYNGEYHVYVGVNGRNRKYPCMAVRTDDRSCRKMTASFFERVRASS